MTSVVEFETNRNIVARSKSIVDLIAADRNLAITSKILRTAQLNIALSQKGPFTIFAPSDVAFRKLPAGRIQQLMKAESVDELTNLLNNHVVRGQINFSDLQDKQTLITKSGKQLNVAIELNGKVTVNGAIVQSKDNVGFNGVVHSLDTVIELK